jgi:NADH:ubiquinone oxidoreductase subunit 4 (chain M)
MYATLLVIFGLSSLGLPGTNSFVGEFLVLVGTFYWSKIATAFASLGIILAATYLLWMLQRVVFGVPDPHHSEAQGPQPAGIRHAGATRSVDILDRALSESTRESDAPERDQHHCLHVPREGRADCSPLCRCDSTTAGGQRRAAEDPGPIAMSLYGATSWPCFPNWLWSSRPVSSSRWTPSLRLRDEISWLGSVWVRLPSVLDYRLADQHAECPGVYI